MDKFNQLLNENTIIDFRLLWKLGLRYRSHFIIALIFLIAIFSYNYYAQPVIYAVNVPIKATTNHTVSHDLSALLPVDNASSVNLGELKISMGSTSFLRSYAELTILDPDFKKFNFGAISGNKNLFGRELKNACANSKECLINLLTNSLAGTFSLEQGLTENRFILTVNAIEKRTAQRLTSILTKALDLNRIHVRQYMVLKEVESVGKLVDESRSIMKKMDGYTALEEQEKLQNEINDLKERIKMLQYSSNLEVANITSLESKLSENKKSTKNRGTKSQAELEKIQKVQSRLIEINQNIAILSSIPEEKRTVSDELIVSQLKEDKTDLLKGLPSESHRKKIELSEHFIEGQRGKAGDYEFDYQVAKNKLKKLNQDYETSKLELNELIQKKIFNENKVIRMKVDLDFLKKLEEKQMSLRLLSATMTSDIYFEDNNPAASEFRRSTYLKIFLFSFSITFFLYLISILIRYLADDLIYGEEDIKNHLKGLDFIGEAPVFE